MKINDDSKKILIQKLEIMLGHLDVNESDIIINPPFFPCLSRFFRELHKSKSKYLSDNDIAGVLFSHFYDVFNSIKDKKKTGNYVDYIGTDLANKLQSDIIYYFDSIPRSLEVKIFFPSATVDYVVHTRLSKDICLEKNKTLRTLQDSLLQPGRPNDECLVLRLENVGYIQDRRSKLWDDILQEIKIIIVLGLYYNIFKVNDAKLKNQPVFGLTKVELLKAYIFDAKLNKNNDFDLPHDLSIFIEKIEFIQHSAGEVFQNKIDKLEQIYKKFFVPHNEIKRIKTALIWAFEADMSINDTFSYIQIFLGLEAILGSGNTKESDLVEKLAIRCSYLIGVNYLDRKNIAKKFRRLYDTRSNLIHGTEAHLNQTEKANLQEAKAILKKVILKEITLLDSTVSSG